jgi:predicted kinase
MRPTVIALTGLPGTGKSKLGAMIYQCLPSEFAYLDIDTVTRPLVQAALTVNRLSLTTAAENGNLRTLRDAQYSCLLDQVRKIVSFERSVLYIAPMTHELADPPEFLRVVASLDPARFLLIRTHASPEVVRSRLEQRGDFLDDLRLSRWEIDRYRYDRPAPLPMSGLELDSSGRSPKSLAEHALRWLSLRLSMVGRTGVEPVSERLISRRDGRPAQAERNRG